MEKQAKMRPKDRVGEAFKDAEKIDLRNEIQEQYGKHPRSWFSWVFSLLDIPSGGRVLELGCGSGAFWEENLARIPRGWDIFLTDRSFTMLRSAREHLGRSHCGSRFLCLDGTHQPFPDDAFDTVVAVGVLDLLPDLPSALMDIRRILKPSGQLVATAGGKGHLKELEMLVRPYLPEETVEQIGGDERRFGLENGKDRLSPCFDRIIRHDYDDQMVFKEHQPVLDYVLSEQMVAGVMTLEQLSSFVRRVKNRLGRNGSISVSIRKGAFVARKTDGPVRACN